MGSTAAIMGLSTYQEDTETEAEDEILIDREKTDKKTKKENLYIKIQAVTLTSVVLILLIVYLVPASESSSGASISSITQQAELVNDRPIIGILTQELDTELVSVLGTGSNYSSYLAASYVQWVEAGGARVVPVIIGQGEQYYRELFPHLNGLLLPGGSAPPTGEGGYAVVGGLLYELAIQANDAGDTFPIWGTCNGFELLTVLSSRDLSRLTNCDSQDQAVPLNFLPEWHYSNLFSEAPSDVLREIAEEKITINFHDHCLTPTNFTKYGMGRFWNALSYNYDRYNLEYISSIEAKNYPFVGVQFHPEKNIFEWNRKEPRIPHSSHAVHVSLYFATHFVNLARLSKHRFADRSTEEKYLIYQYQPTYIGRQDIDLTFEMAYLF